MGSLPLTSTLIIDLLRGEGCVVVAVSGEVDLCTAPLLAEELRRAQPLDGVLVVDLDQVEFMDCAGLRALVDFADEVASGPTRLLVTPGSRQVQRLFELSGIATQLCVVPHANAAERAAA